MDSILPMFLLTLYIRVQFVISFHTIIKRGAHLCYAFSWGGGGLNLGYDSSSSSCVDCLVFSVMCDCFFDGMGFVYPRAPPSLDSSLEAPSAVHTPSGWVLDGYPSYSLYLVSSIHIYPVVCCVECLGVAGGDFYFVCVLSHLSNLRLVNRLLIVILLLPPPWALRKTHCTRL